MMKQTSAPIPAAAAPRIENEERLIGAGSTKRDITLVVEADARGERVGTGVEKDDLPTGTRGDGCVDQRRRSPQDSAWRRWRCDWEYRDYASLTPVDPPTRCDDRLGLSACSKTQQKGGQPKRSLRLTNRNAQRSAVRTCASARAQASGGPQVTGSKSLQN